MSKHVEVESVSLGCPSRDKESLDRICEIAGREERYAVDVLRMVVRLGFQALDRGHSLICPGPGCRCSRELEPDATGVVVAFRARD